jgi:Zinc-binding loop region of homing endonuclease
VVTEKKDFLIKMLSVAERFESHYIPEPNSGCWLWTSQKNNKNYGLLRIHDHGVVKKVQAHRLSVVLSGRVLADHEHVLHKCDNPYCVNPDHLQVGSHAENMRDMKNKGRGRSVCGMAHPKSKLTDVLVREIRVSEENNSVLGRRIGVSNVLVSMVRLGKIWKHVQ